MLIDLSTAYDTVWRKGFTLKFLKAVPSNKIGNLVNTIMLSNRRFRVFINDKSNRTRVLNNGLPQGTVCAPSYFNLYTSDQPSTTSRKFGYADDTALAVRVKTFEAGENLLQRDIQKMRKYYIKWRLCLNLRKTEVTMFHLNNRQAKQELNVYIDGVRIEHNFVPTYLGAPLDSDIQTITGTTRRKIENSKQFGPKIVRN